MVILTVTYTFDPDYKCYKFDTYDETFSYMKWFYNRSLKEEIKENADELDPKQTYYSDNYAQIAWKNGDRIEFYIMSSFDKIDKNYPEQPKSDGYKIKQLKEMLDYETNPDTKHYGAKLKHWNAGKILTIDRGAIKALIEYYENHDTDLEADINDD